MEIGDMVGYGTECSYWKDIEVIVMSKWRQNGAKMVPKLGDRCIWKVAQNYFGFFCPLMLSLWSIQVDWYQ